MTKYMSSKMYIRTLTLSAGLSLVPASAGVELSGDGIGEVLIFPFFIADNGWDTYLNVQAVSRRTASPSGWPALSLRVVLREGRNGEIIDTFNTYATNLNGQSAWRAALYRNTQGQTRLRVGEGQCLVDSNGQAHAGAGVELPVAATVGLIEVYSMAEPSRVDEALEEALDCEELAANWESPDGRWTVDPTDDRELYWASAISGQGTLINVQQGLSGVYQATALRNFAGGELLVHTDPGSLSPNLADAQPGVISTVLQPDGITTVAKLLTTRALSNDVVALDEVAASTDWIISYPTSGYHAARPFDVEVGGESRNCSSFGFYGPELGPEEPTVLTSTTQAKNVFFSSTIDGAWRGSYGDPQFSPTPGTQTGVALCNAVNVLTFDGRPSMLLPEGSPYLENLDGLVSDSGHLWWAPVGDQLGAFGGEPVLALRLTRFVNGTLEGGSVLSNYLFMDAHRRDVDIHELDMEIDPDIGTSLQPGAVD